MSTKTIISATDDLRELIDKIPEIKDVSEKILSIEAAQQMTMSLFHLLEAEELPLLTSISEDLLDIGKRVRTLESKAKSMTAQMAIIETEAREKGLID